MLPMMMKAKVAAYLDDAIAARPSNDTSGRKLKFMLMYSKE